MNNNSKYIRF